MILYTAPIASVLASILAPKNGMGIISIVISPCEKMGSVRILILLMAVSAYVFSAEIALR